MNTKTIFEKLDKIPVFVFPYETNSDFKNDSYLDYSRALGKPVLIITENDVDISELERYLKKGLILFRVVRFAKLELSKTKTGIEVVNFFINLLVNDLKKEK